MKRLVTFVKKCPLICMIILSVVGISSYAIFGICVGKYDLNIGWNHPLLSSVLLKEYSEEEKMSEHTQLVEKEDEPVNSNQSNKSLAENEKENPEDSHINNSDEEEKNEDKTEEVVYETKFETVEMRKARSAYYSDNDKIALSTDCPYITVDDSFFEDAVFIGDSRMEGFSEYAGIKTADYFYKEGLTVYGLMKDDVYSKKHKLTTVKKALKKKQYKKIYIMVGINELGLRKTADYKKQYEKNIEEIKELQPEAIITIIGVMRVTTKYSEKSDVFNNDNIDDRNRAAAELADGVRVFYLDMNEAVIDEDGGVIADYTWDGVHLKAEYYKLWADFMRNHGLELDQENNEN